MDRGNTTLQHSKGFSLIEVMTVVAIVGILATIAIPLYLEFQSRTRVSEVLASIGACKANVIDFYLENAGWTRADGTNISTVTVCSQSGSEYETPGTMSVSNVGIISVEVQNLGSGIADGEVVTSAPVIVVNQITGWRCGNPADGTTLEERFLPGTCQG